MHVDGERLRQLRRRKGYSLRALAGRAGVDERTVRRAEGGIGEPRGLTLQLLAQVLECEVEDLLTPITGAGESDAAPVAASPEEARWLLPRQVPSPPANFLGREREVEALVGAVRDGAHVALVTGMGGVGKTALACELARRLAPRFPDGQCFLDLRGTTEPLDPVNAMRHVLWSIHPAAATEEDADRVPAAYRSALGTRRMLLVLDNLADATQLVPLLPPESCRILATCRRLFELPGAHALVLRPLTRVASRELLTSFGSVSGWEDRLAELCGDLPLALTLAASTMTQPDMDAREYVETLARETTRIAALDRGSATGGVGPSLEQSIAKLGAPMRDRFLLLSAFPADFDRAAACALWETTALDAATDLAELRRLHLVEHRGGRGASARYDLHDLVRAYVAARVSESVREEAQRRCVRYFAGLLQDAEAGLSSPTRDHLAYSRVSCELRSIEWAFRWCEQRAAHDEEAGAFFRALPTARVLSAFQVTTTRIEWCTSALRSAWELGERGIVARLEERLGSALRDRGELRESIAHFAAALERLGEHRDDCSRCAALLSLGVAACHLGQTQRGVALLQESLALARSIGDHRLEADALRQVGVGLFLAGELADAADHLAAALRAADRCANLPLLGMTFLAKALLHRFAEDPSEATRAGERALEIATAIGAPSLELQASLIVAWAALDLGRVTEASERLESAHARAGTLSQRNFDVYTFLVGAVIARARGDACLATQRIEACREEAERSGLLWVSGAALDVRAALCLDSGDVATAMTYLRERLRIARTIQDRLGEASARWTIGELCLEQGGAEAALTEMELATSYHEAMKLPCAAAHRELVVRLRSTRGARA